MQKTLLLTIDFPPQIGGVAEYQKGLLAHLDPEKVVVLANRAPASYQFDFEADYKIYRRKMFFKSLLVWPKCLPMLYSAYQLVKKEKIEKIWVGQLLPSGTVALILKRWLGIHYVVNLHGTDILTALSQSHKISLVKKILNEADYLTTNSLFTKKILLDFGVKPEEKITVLQPCPQEVAINQEELSLAKTAIIDQYNLLDKKILLFVGRLTVRKGIDQIIAIMPELLAHEPNLVYVVVGNGSDEKYLRNLAIKHQVEKRVIFTGKKIGTELMALFDLAEILVMTSVVNEGVDVESFGMVYLEANLFSKPVIATDTGGVNEAVINGETGVVVPVGNKKLIKAAILKLLADKELAVKLGRQGKERVLKDFKWAERAAKFKELLN